MSQTCRPPLNLRIVLGALIIKHMCNLSDRETVDQISENIYMQYFLGYPSFTNETPFDPSLFVEFRKWLGMIIALKTQIEKRIIANNPTTESMSSNESDDNQPNETDELEHKGRVIFDATACPQNIAYPTDMNLLNDAREKLEELIDIVYDPAIHAFKTRTYREVARQTYLRTAQKKRTGHKVIRTAIREQLNYVRRDIRSIHTLLDAYEELPFPLKHSEQKYLFVVQTLYEQQKQMYDTNLSADPKNRQRKVLLQTQTYGPWMADVHLTGFPPAFTLHHDSECK